MSKPEQKQVIVELQNGDKCEGVLANIDKVNLKILLVNAKKTPASDPTKPESFEKLEINKGDIKEIKVIQFEVKTEPKEEQSNINAIPEDKKPVNVQQTKTKGYDKNESFFDTLTGMTHPEARQESKNYNDKNKDTFNLPNEPERRYHNNGYNNYHNNRGRGRYHNRGNRGRGRGGYNNYNNYNNGGNYYNNNNYYNHNYYNTTQNNKERYYSRDTRQYENKSLEYMKEKIIEMMIDIETKFEYDYTEIIDNLKDKISINVYKREGFFIK